MFYTRPTWFTGPEQLDFWPLQFTPISNGVLPKGAVVERTDACWVWYRVIT